MEQKLWANSGDPHVVEPADLFDVNPDGLWETVTVDGQTFRRRMPKPWKAG